MNYEEYISDIDYGINRLSGDLLLVEGMIMSLCQDIFSTPENSYDRIIKGSDRRGVDAIMRELRNKTPWRGRELIGFLRGGLFNRGDRQRALADIERLEPVLMQRRELQTRLKAMKVARQRALEQQDRDRFPKPDRSWFARRSRGRNDDE